MSQDDELVAVLAEGQDLDDMPAARIRMSEYTPEVEALYGCIDRLGDVVSGLVGLGGKKPPHIAAMKRPETAWERIAHSRDVEKHERTVRRLLPNGYVPLPETG